MAESRVIAWLHAHLPTREGLANNRMLKPFADHFLRGELWRFTRRSVPRGVAIGLFVSILSPVAHMALAALAAIFVRANIVVAAAVTWVVNPFTIVPIWIAGYRIGHLLLHDARLAAVLRWAGVIHGHPHHHHRRLEMGLAVGIGLAVEAVVAAVLGYALAALLWRLRIMRAAQARAEARLNTAA